MPLSCVVLVGDLRGGDLAGLAVARVGMTQVLALNGAGARWLARRRARISQPRLPETEYVVTELIPERTFMHPRTA